MEGYLNLFSNNMVHKWMLWAFLVLLLPGCENRKHESTAEIKLKELSGEAIDLGEYKGSVVFLNVWATWCKPCLQEMPSIARAQEMLKDSSVVFILASNEDVEDIARFSENHPWPFHYVQLQNLEELGIQALPTTFILDDAGTVKFNEAGYRMWDEPQNLKLIKTIRRSDDE